jgi:hypothetical protein
VATNKPVGDNARKGAVKKLSQLKSTLGGATVGERRDTAGFAKVGNEEPLQKDALVTLIDTNQRLREKAVALMLEIEMLRER